MRVVRRVTVFDGVNIPLTTLVNVILSNFSVRFIVISVNPNSVTYDLEVRYDTSPGFPGDLEYSILSNLTSDGEDITDEIVSDAMNAPMMDIHVRDITNGRVITNVVIVDQTQ